MLRWSLPKVATAPFCPSEVAGTVAVPEGATRWRKLLAFLGPGLLVAVGYMDPGNWATDIEGGARFGYLLLSIIFLSNLMAMLLQGLCVRLGIVSGKDLAQLCQQQFHPAINFALWIFAEIAIIACDLAELLGSALALKLLFHLPLALGVVVTGFDIMVVLLLQGKGFRWLEAMVLGLIGTIALCFLLEIFFSQPDWTAVAQGFLPRSEIVRQPEMLYLAVSIIGATVMPHNLYLHSSVVQTRSWQKVLSGPAEAIRYATLDSTIALVGALFVNAAILIVAAATFHYSGNQQVAEIEDAYRLLAPLLGTGAASVLFGVALLVSGQSSTFTGTLAGQIVMEGFLNWWIPCWLRRLITRSLAIAPTLVAILVFGEQSVGRMLVFSQVVLSLQLPFAIVPLILFTGDRAIMGRFANPSWLKGLAWLAAIVITGLNVWLLVQTIGNLSG
jgi:manganese transport protein